MPSKLSHLDSFSLILQSGPMAKFVLLLLLLASIGCWSVIFAKIFSFKRAKKENLKFLNLFWGGKKIEDIFEQSEHFKFSPVATVFHSGFKELKKLTSLETKSIVQSDIENVSRSLSRATFYEVTCLEKYIGSLATTASATPFVGLFGTIWGIMNSFQNIGVTGAANLAVVAPGISEALVTTAAGIGAAVPAVIAYNYFVGQIKKMTSEMDCFSQDMLNIVQRSFIQTRKGGG